MELQVKNGGVASVSDAVFGAEFNEALVHQVVTSFLATGRAGTKAQKTRSEVSGGGAKPWKQKGTGRARAGTIRSPIWRTGGVAFAAKPRDFSQKINRKMYRGALRSILSELLRQERLIVVEVFEATEAKTKQFLAKFAELNIAQDALLVATDVDAALYLGARNVPNIAVIDAKGIDPVLLLSYQYVVIDKASLEFIGGWLS